MILFIVLGVWSLLSLVIVARVCWTEHKKEQVYRDQLLDREYESMCNNAREDGFIQ